MLGRGGRSAQMIMVIIIVMIMVIVMVIVPWIYILDDQTLIADLEDHDSWDDHDNPEDYDLDCWFEGEDTEHDDACDSNRCEAGLIPVT